jgi:hypothetical protein
MVSKIKTELKTKGRMEIINDSLRSVIIAKEAIVIPIAKEPVFPTNILP